MELWEAVKPSTSAQCLVICNACLSACIFVTIFSAQDAHILFQESQINILPIPFPSHTFAGTTVLRSKIEDVAADIATDEKTWQQRPRFAIKNEPISKQAKRSWLMQAIHWIVRWRSSSEKCPKGSSSMMQLKVANSLTQVFNVMVQASAMTTAEVACLRPKFKQ